MGGRLPLPVPAKSSLVVPLALFTSMVGLFAVISRRKALTQILGYLVMENGIYAFGLAFACLPVCFYYIISILKLISGTKKNVA
jgi:hydrogenase-4 component E